MPAIMSATPIAVLSFLGFDGISTLAEDARTTAQRGAGNGAGVLCGGHDLHSATYLGQLIWPDYTRFHPIETAFSDIGRLIGGSGLFPDSLFGYRAGLGQRDHKPGKRVAPFVRNGT